MSSPAASTPHPETELKGSRRRGWWRRPGSGPRKLSHSAAFWCVTGMFVAFLAASSAPSPLYVVYQDEWGFSATTLTLVFAVYVFGLLGALLIVGALSDHVGRRPVMAGAIALESVALVLFIVAGDVTVLAVARVAQGVATGAAISTLGAALVDLNPPEAPGRAGMINGVAPISGLAIGALGCGALVQFAPEPTHLIYGLLLVGMAISAVIVGLMPETSARKPGGWDSLKPRLGIPPRLRPRVLGLVPVLIATWALGGLYLSLGPSDASVLFGLESHLIGGLVVTLLCGTAAITAFAMQGRSSGQLLAVAATLLGVGTLVTLIGVQSGSAIVAAVGTVLAGIGFGSSALGFFGTLAVIAAPEERAELFAVAYVIAYLAFSIPALIAGLAATSEGLHDTTIAYGLVVVALCLAALGAQRLLAGRPAGATG